MSQGIDLTGMVLLAVPYGEYDRRVVLLTKERGKITAFAHGARRPNSQLVGATSPFTFGTFTLFEGRSAYTLGGADVKDYFSGVKEDLTGALYGSYFMELADYYARENLDASLMLNLLYVTLRALENPALPDRLVRYAYEIRLMVVNGEYPWEEVLAGNLSELAAYTIRYICTAPLQKLYAFSVPDSVVDEIARVQDRYRAKIVDVRLKSLDILKTLL